MPQAIPSALDRLVPDIIVNPAAYTAVDKAEVEPELFDAGERAKRQRISPAGPRRGQRFPLIHFSTDYVFDGSGETRLARG